MDSSSNSKHLIAKIYKMTSSNGKVYIGCTTQKYLSARIRQHRSNAKTKRDCTSRELFELNEDGSEPVVSVELLEDKVITDRSQSKEMERKYIESMECVNKCVTGRSVAETNKAYNDANKDKRKAWHDANKEKTAAYKRMWRLKNIEKARVEKEMADLKQEIYKIDIDEDLKD